MRELIFRYGPISICGMAVLLLAGSAVGGKGKTTLCHVPPGNPSNAHEISVGKSAVKSHLRNHAGDSIGACPVLCDDSSDCDDGNACTVDVCTRDGSCDNSEPIVCDDGILCTIDACIPDIGCSHVPDPDCESQCCDPGDEPGVGDNPICFEGATCCDDGTWRCNSPTGANTCAGSIGEVCEDVLCCDPDLRPSCFGTVDGGGASCCGDGIWRCNDPQTGIDTCPGPLGPVCDDPDVCDPSLPPGDPNACPGVCDPDLPPGDPEACCDPLAPPGSPEACCDPSAPPGDPAGCGPGDCDPDAPPGDIGACCDPNLPPGIPGACCDPNAPGGDPDICLPLST